MFVLKLALLAAFCAGAQSGLSSGLACSLKMDLAFLIDSSSSVKEENFELIRQFVVNVVQQLDIGPDATRVSLARYNNWVDSRFHFNTLTTKDEVIKAIRETPYYGRGTNTANGLSVLENQHIREYNGWRKNEVPTVVVILTDGKAQDAELIPTIARKLRSKVTKVIAVGVGKADESELELIATRPFDENVIYIGEFSSLTSLVIRLASQACAVRDDVNECRENNGGCDTFCINTADAFYCECNEGFQVAADGLGCADIDECLVDTECGSTCENTPGSFICTCPVGEILQDDGKNCVADSCFLNNECEQECTNIMDGDFVCSCLPGFVLNEDGRTCSDIDECEVAKGGCEFECNNTAGSYECVCDEGFALRADGHTCGIQCYVCDRATSNEECNQIEVCPPNALSCQTHVRNEQGVSYISKMCKQTEACVNNYIQNPRTAWSPTQCNDESLTTSVCRCCCHRSLCNSLADCDKEKEIDIECPDPSTFEIPEGLQVECEGNQLGHRCQLICPAGFAPDTGSTELVCTHRPRTTEGYWLGEIGPCVDIDECAVNNGGCSHFCTNTEGSYSCSCYDPFECAGAAVDVLFILDSSSSVRNANFELMKSFVTRIVNPLNVGQDGVRVALMRYNRFQIKEFDFADVANNTDLTEKIAAVPYDGRGTRTASAIEYAISSMIQNPDSGRRPSFPLITIILTDGRSYRDVDLENAASRLHAVSDAVFAIGISRRVNERELLVIANNRTQNYRLIDSFEDLDDDLVELVSDQLCTETEGVHLLMVDGLNCDINECALENGGCSHFCNNTIGSYFCSCPDGQTVIEDGATCVLNDCLIDNGGCEFECVQFSTGRRCMCPNSKQFEDEGCVNYNECDDANGGCSDICEDLEDGYRCACPLGSTLTGDGLSCEIDSCFDQGWPFVCSQGCENVPGGSYQCTCDDGYMMEDDGHNCTEIDECQFGNGGCEHTCINTDGSYRCECPADQDLRADGKTCGIQCFECVNVMDPDLECQPVVCDPSADACFTTHRTRDNITMTTKGCKQTMACINNMIQNPAAAGEGPSQCNLNLQNSKCECCCMTSLCNEGDCPYDNFTLPSCPSFQKAFTVFTGLQADGTVLAGGMARVDCGQGYVLAETEGSLVQIQCAYNFVNGTAEWENDYRDLDTCIDIDECDTENNGGCQAPAFCVNLPGSFECRCPEEPADYVLVEGTVCERNECADEDQGGCTDNCTNTIGGYFCSCPPGMSIVGEEGLICDPDECMDANGGCHQLCVNEIGGFRCACHSEGYTIGDDGQTCVDVDECAVDNGQCSDICNNLVPGYECQCPEGLVLQPDGFQCLPDPCFINNGGCSQICTAVGEAVSCSCNPGFELLDDGTCVDIDECEDGIANCQYNCTNFDGGYTCECPVGEALRNDGRTCGRACYACNGAATNEECNVNIEVCPMDADACENEVRVHGGRKSIFKRCKQAHACNNNRIQNPRSAWLPSQCNGEVQNDVCRCCCSGHLCNFNERPCATKAEDCALRQADIIVILDSSSSVKYDDFQLMKNFAKEIFSSYNIGENAVRAGLIRYNRRVHVQFSLNDHSTLDDVLDAVDATEHSGSGTRTGQALQHVIDTELTEAKGARPGVPKIVITVTDGKSQDDVEGPSTELRRQGVKTIGVGIGAGIDREEIAIIGGSESNTIVSESFEDIFNQLEAIRLETCRDTDECETNNGGCSDGCQNTPGSFYCTCPEGLFLQEDLVTCGTEIANQSSPIFNECAQDNGGCAQVCTDLRDGYSCSCNTGYGLRDDERTCAEINECDSEDTNPCSHTCVNTDGGFFCECPEDHEMSEDLATCVPRPGPADCPAGFQAIAGSCVQLLQDSLTNAGAESACAAIGGRLATIRNKGVYDLYRRVFGNAIQEDVYIGLEDIDGDGIWTNSDGTNFALDQYWGPNQPGNGQCGVVTPGSFTFASRPCTDRLSAICQIPRENGFVVFSRTWPNGAQGKLYFPYGADQVRVQFPKNLKSLNVWFGTKTEVTKRVYTVSQNDIEIQSGMGEAQFVCDMGTTRFPDYNVEVTVDP